MRVVPSLETFEPAQTEGLHLCRCVSTDLCKKKRGEMVTRNLLTRSISTSKLLGNSGHTSAHSFHFEFSVKQKALMTKIRKRNGLKLWENMPSKLYSSTMLLKSRMSSRIISWNFFILVLRQGFCSSVSDKDLYTHLGMKCFFMFWPWSRRDGWLLKSAHQMHCLLNSTFMLAWPLYH